MVQLTYADRELLLRTLDSIKEEWDGSDSDLLGRIFDWAKQLEPTYGFEHTLTRDATTLSRYLDTHKADSDIADIARGALLYVLRDLEDHPNRLRKLGLLDEAFVCNYAVHEIKRRLGEPAAYAPPRLEKSERTRAENLFVEFLGQCSDTDADLVSAVEATMQSWGNLRDAGLFRRLRRDIEFLIGVFSDSQRSDEQREYARAALAYVACEADAIEDRLGLVGFIDDCFIAHLAVELIEPNREPWLELLDGVVASWPFLNNFLLDDGAEVRLPSEYTIVNCALTCSELRPTTDPVSALLVVPTTGPTPFLLGVVATIGLIRSTGKHEVTESDFRYGQKVLVDHCAIAEFAGFDECNGRRMFKLRQFRMERGQRLESVRYWPISDLVRLTPTDSSRATRGTLNYDLSYSDATLPGLEYLFGDKSTTQLAAVERRIVVVGTIATAFELAKALHLHGWSLKDVIPMGHLGADGEDISRWSNRFGNL
ncbi:MAG: hypothetical protein HYV60_06375 [Planctomycetia bacterium]|nr:hypothetical protein [Planctomycetia bacterium]